jgi:hypothetical protein
VNHAESGVHCSAQIGHELRYQSSLDLDERTYATISRVPLAREVVAHSRQHLVQRLDDYQLSHTDVFHKVRVPCRHDLHPRPSPLHAVSKAHPKALPECSNMYPHVASGKYAHPVTC